MSRLQEAPAPCFSPPLRVCAACTLPRGAGGPNSSPACSVADSPVAVLADVPGWCTFRKPREAPCAENLTWLPGALPEFYCFGSVRCGRLPSASGVRRTWAGVSARPLLSTSGVRAGPRVGVARAGPPVGVARTGPPCLHRKEGLLAPPCSALAWVSACDWAL